MNQNADISYDGTIRACFTAYVVQAIVNNFVPLLFLILQKEYGIPLSQITLLITINFSLQLIIDGASAVFIDKIGYRASVLIAHFSASLGLILLSFLPEAMPSHFAGLLVSVLFYAVGGGLIEVMISPIVEACPTDNKASAMSLLHSFYNWGSAAVIIITTLLLKIFGSSSWRVLAVLWASVPLINGIAFIKVPIAELIEDDEGMGIKDLLKCRTFWFFAVLMLCSGASEQSVGQWASTIAEKGLNISKALGDLTGPALFAVMQGTSRMLYAKSGNRISLKKTMILSSVLCIISYLLMILSKNPVFSLAGMAITGFAVGIMWPGTFSLSSASIKRGGTAMFALLALAGDLGCSAGPTLAGFAANHFGENLKLGIAASLIFPELMLMMLSLSSEKKEAKI